MRLPRPGPDHSRQLIQRDERPGPAVVDLDVIGGDERDGAHAVAAVAGKHPHLLPCRGQLGEMGRTPVPANRQWGRGHWSTLFPAVIAGGGVRGGIAHGRSDKDAALPKERPVSPEDLAATVYHALGIDPELRVNDPDGRPVPLVEDGKPVLELFG